MHSRDPRGRSGSPPPFKSPWEPPTLNSRPPDPVPTSPLQLSPPSTPPRPVPTLSEVVPSLVGQSFGRYRILSVIQRGGMGEIFLADIVEGAGRGGRAVLKRLLADFLDDGTYAQMFQAEVRVMSRLHHPNIVQVLDVPTVDGKQCLALEFVQGRNLLQVLKQVKKAGLILPPQLALYVIGKALEGLEHAHRATGEDGQPLELVHRDVTPGNILLSYDGAVKITDFGIAKSRMSQVATSVGVVKGTTRYLSPEQIRGEPVTARTDLFSAAVVLTEMLTGTPLYDRGSVPPTLFAIVKAERPPIEQLLPFSAPRLSAAIERALALDPAERFASAREMADALGLAQWDLGQQVDRADLSIFLKRLFQGAPDLAQAEAAVAADASLDLTYLFDVHDAGLGKDPEVLTPVAFEEARASLKDLVSGAKPLVAAEFNKGGGKPRHGPPPERARDVRLVNVTVPVEVPDIESEQPDPAAKVVPDPSEVVTTMAPPASPRISDNRNDAVLEALEKASAELEAVERRRQSGINVAPLEMPTGRGKSLGALLFVAGLFAGVVLVTWPNEDPVTSAPTPRPVPSAAAPTLADDEAPEELSTEVDVEEARPTPRSAYLEVKGPKGARVRIDGVLQRRRAPLSGLPLEPGKHTIQISKRSYQRMVLVDAVAGERLDVTSDPVKVTRPD